MKENKPKKVPWTGDYQAFGLVECPRTETEFRGVMAARTAIEALECYPDARDKMASGMPRKDIADYIQQTQKECTTTALRTMMCYVGLYRRFIIPPVEFIREPARHGRLPHLPGEGLPQTGPPAFKDKALLNPIEILSQKVTLLQHGVQEATVLENLIHAQAERVTGAIAVEKATCGGWLHKDLKDEVRLLGDLCKTLQQMKSALGVYQDMGYGLAALKLDVHHGGQVVNLLQQMPNEQRQLVDPVLHDFGEKLHAMFDRIKAKASPAPEPESVMAHV